MILHHFCRRSSKIMLFWPKTLIFDQKSRKYSTNSEKYSKIQGFLGFPRDPCGPIVHGPRPPLWPRVAAFGGLCGLALWIASSFEGKVSSCPGWDPYGPSWVLLDRSWQVRTCPISDFWSNFACCRFESCFLTKFPDDSAWFCWFCVEELKKYFPSKNVLFDKKTDLDPTNPKKSWKYVLY